VDDNDDFDAAEDYDRRMRALVAERRKKTERDEDDGADVHSEAEN